MLQYAQIWRNLANMSKTQQAELKALEQKIVAARGRAGRDAWNIGAHLARIKQGELWRSGGYESFSDYLARGVDCSRASAYRYLRIAEHFNAEIAELYGIDKLLLVLRFMALTPAEERPGDIFVAQVRVRGENGRFRSVSVHEASAAQLEEGILLEQKRLEQRRRAPRTMQARAERVSKALPEPPKGVSRQRVRLRKHAEGQVLASFFSIPLEHVGVLFQAVQSELLGAWESAPASGRVLSRGGAKRSRGSTRSHSRVVAEG